MQTNNHCEGHKHYYFGHMKTICNGLDYSLFPAANLVFRTLRLRTFFLLLLEFYILNFVFLWHTFLQNKIHRILTICIFYDQFLLERIFSQIKVDLNSLQTWQHLILLHFVFYFFLSAEVICEKCCWRPSTNDFWEMKQSIFVRKTHTVFIFWIFLMSFIFFHLTLFHSFLHISCDSD